MNSATPLSSQFVPGTEGASERQLTVVVQGLEKCGKSLFGSGSMPSYTQSPEFLPPNTPPPPVVLAPRPLVVLSLDGSFEKIRPSLPPAALKDLYYQPWKHHFDPKKAAQISASEAGEIMGELDEKFEAAVQGGARTIFLDTESEAWALERLAAGQRPGRAPKDKKDFKDRISAGWKGDIDWDLVNGNYATRLRGAKDAGVHLILSRKLKAKYVNDKWDGLSYIADGFKGIGFIMDAAVEVSRATSGLFMMKMMGSHYNPHLFHKAWNQNDRLGAEYLAANPEDLEWVGRIPVISFAAVAKMCFPNSKMSEWGVE